MRMNNSIKVYMALSLLAALPSARGDIVTINPATGWSGYFHWSNGVGSLDGIQTNAYVVSGGVPVPPFTTGPGEWKWSITLPAAGVMTSINSHDPYYPPGDQWDLYVDGSLVPWTSIYTGTGPKDDAHNNYTGTWSDPGGQNSTSGYFFADYSNLALSAGTHILALEITAIPPINIHIGEGAIEFSAAAVALPVPGAVVLGLIGLGMAGWLHKRRAP